MNLPGRNPGPSLGAQRARELHVTSVAGKYCARVRNRRPRQKFNVQVLLKRPFVHNDIRLMAGTVTTRSLTLSATVVAHLDCHFAPEAENIDLVVAI
jgi:hypothetical protein